MKENDKSQGTDPSYDPLFAADRKAMKSLRAGAKKVRVPTLALAAVVALLFASVVFAALAVRKGMNRGAASAGADVSPPREAPAATAAAEVKPPPPPSPPPAPSLAFGSSLLLSRCWTAEELLGSPEEKVIERPCKRPCSDDPERRAPITQLDPRESIDCNSIRSVETDEGRKLVALTFDLCERSNEIAGYDAAIIDYLRARRIKATFFAGGKWMKSHPERTMQLMADPLFEVANHAWTHLNLRTASPEVVRDQVMWTQAQYEVLRERLLARPCAAGLGEESQKVPLLPLVFRYPFGVWSPASMAFVNGHGLAAIQWDVVTGDPAKGQTGLAIARIVRTGVKPGSIIIGHANGRGHGTADSLPIIVPELIERGYEFVTVSELLLSGRPLAAEECYELHPGDNKEYDLTAK